MIGLLAQRVTSNDRVQMIEQFESCIVIIQWIFIASYYDYVCCMRFENMISINSHSCRIQIVIVRCTANLLGSNGRQTNI